MGRRCLLVWRILLQNQVVLPVQMQETEPVAQPVVVIEMEEQVCSTIERDWGAPGRSDLCRRRWGQEICGLLTPLQTKQSDGAQSQHTCFIP